MSFQVNVAQFEIRTRDLTYTGDNTFEGTNSYPGQPCFMAYCNSKQTNFFGDGSAETVPMNTEIFDQANNYDPTTYKFTAPRAGRYMFYASVEIDNVTLNTDIITVAILAGGINYRLFYGHGAIAPSTGEVTLSGTIMSNLSQSATAEVLVFATRTTGSGKNLDILASNNTDKLYTVFGGYLLA